MTDFKRDCLRFCVRVGTDRPETFNIASRDNPDANIASLAAFALALLDQNEADQRELIERGKDIHTLTCALESERLRAEKAEAERDEANDERDDAVDRWARRAREAEATCKELLQVQAERDRLRAQLDSILANSDSLESGKLADANAEIARLREKLRAWQEKSDRHESERDSFRLEADRLREKGAWLQAEVDVLRGKACDEEQAAGNGPCGACRTCRNKRLAELEAENAKLRKCIAEARLAMMEPHGEWKDVREAKALDMIRVEVDK